MSYDNDGSWFWELLGIGVASTIAYGAGKKKGWQEMQDAQRDAEIRELKAQVERLRLERKE